MFPQPQPDTYYDGLNEYLFAAVPSRAKRILEVGCARGRLGHELKLQDPSRYVAGLELDPDAARAAEGRLEDVLRRYRDLLSHDGLVLISVPNIQHFSVIKNLLRGDFMYQPAGLLDGTHLRFFTHMSFAKLMLDAGFLPKIEDRIRSGEAQHVVEPA